MSCAARSAYGPAAPKPEIDAQISRGCRAARLGPSTPSRRAVEGRKLSTSTSLVAMSASSTGGASGDRRSSVMLRLLRLRSSKYTFPATRRIPSPPRGSSILITSAPRSARSSVAYAPGSRRVRSRIRTPRRGSCTRAYFAVAEAVGEVQHEPDRQPDAEALPCRPRQSVHDEHAPGGRKDADRPHERHPERSWPAGLGATKHEHADADQHKSEQCSDVCQIVRLTRVADQRPERHEYSSKQRRRPGYARTRMDFRGPLRQQPIARHRKEDARLAVLEYEEHRRHRHRRTERDDPADRTESSQVERARERIGDR